MVTGKLKLVVIAIAVFSLYTYLVYSNASSAGYDEGYKTVKDEWIEEVRSKENELITLKEEISDLRDSSTSEIEDIKKEHEDEKRNLQKEHDSAISDLHDDIGGLRIDLRERNALKAPEASTPNPKRCDDGASGGKLPKDTARFLIDQAAKADEVAVRLSECQATIMLYIRTLNDYNRLLQKEP